MCLLLYFDLSVNCGSLVFFRFVFLLIHDEYFQDFQV